MLSLSAIGNRVDNRGSDREREELTEQIQDFGPPVTLQGPPKNFSLQFFELTITSAHTMATRVEDTHDELPRSRRVC